MSSSVDEDNRSSSLHLKQQMQASKTSSAPTPPSASPVTVPVPLLAPPTSSHLVSVSRDRERTVPNILSRSKKTVKESPSFQALVPTQVLSLVGASLPGQPVLTMRPLMSTPVAAPASADVASVTFNISGLTSQQIHLTPVLGPQTATNVNNMLQLVQQTGHQPIAKEQQQTQQRQQTQQQHQTHQPTTKEPTQQQAATKQQNQTEEQTTQQQQPTTQKHQLKENEDQPPQISQEGLWKDSSFKGDSDSLVRTENSVVGVTDSMDEPDNSLSKADDSVGQLDGSLKEASALTSLLHEIDFLNQQNAAGTAGLEAELQEDSDAVDVALDQGEPWMLQLDSDSEDTATMESETETMKSQVQSGFLTPPPLLQMKVGGIKEAKPALTELATGEGGGEKGLSWKPMPRLVPLGLRGHAPS